MGIEHLEEMEVYPISGLKRPLRISLSGWRGAIIALPLVIALIVGFLAWLLFTLWVSDESSRTTFRFTVLAGTVPGLLAWICNPCYTLFNDRIVRPPDPGGVAATRPCARSQARGDDHVPRMLRYTARRPICDGEITIKKGRRQHRGRLVGECD